MPYSIIDPTLAILHIALRRQHKRLNGSKTKNIVIEMFLLLNFWTIMSSIRFDTKHSVSNLVVIYDVGVFSLNHIKT